MVARSAFKPRIEKSRRADEWKRCEPFLKWLRGRHCFISLQSKSHVCEGKVRACHFDPFGDKGMGTKVSDSASFPMCDGAHGEQHRIGWQSFQSRYGFDGRDVVTAYWLEWSENTVMGRAWIKQREESAHA